MFQISLAAARVNAGLFQDKAAKMIGVTPKTLRNYEQGKTAIPSIKLRKAAEVYGIKEDRIRLSIIKDGQYDEDEKNLIYTTV